MCSCTTTGNILLQSGWQRHHQGLQVLRVLHPEGPQPGDGILQLLKVGAVGRGQLVLHPCSDILNGSPHFNVSPLCLPAECCPCHGLSGTEYRTVDAASLIPVSQWIFVLGWWNFPRSFIREVLTPGKKIRVLGRPQMILFSKNDRSSFIAYTVYVVFMWLCYFEFSKSCRTISVNLQHTVLLSPMHFR